MSLMVIASRTCPTQKSFLVECDHWSFPSHPCHVPIAHLIDLCEIHAESHRDVALQGSVDGAQKEESVLVGSVYGLFNCKINVFEAKVEVYINPD
jgi:hypothetical protein